MEFSFVDGEYLHTGKFGKVIIINCFSGSLQVDTESRGTEVVNAASISANTTGSISLPPELFATLPDSNLGLVFTMFNTSVLYPLANETRETFAVASTVVGATVAGHTVTGLSTNVSIVLKLMEAVRTYIIAMFLPSTYVFQLQACTDVSDTIQPSLNAKLVNCLMANCSDLHCCTASNFEFTCYTLFFPVSVMYDYHQF